MKEIGRRVVAAPTFTEVTFDYFVDGVGKAVKGRLWSVQFLDDG